MMASSIASWSPSTATRSSSPFPGLDDKSRELDEALQNHDVGGQKINIDEGSLAFPVSGEKSFDEAGETKRQAQAEIAKARPRYRQEEKGVIGRSQNDIDSLVNVQGLLGHHGLRSEGFKKVLGAQERHKTGIVSVKQMFSEEVDRIYKNTKEKVDEALNSLTEGYTIEEDLEEILSDAESYFKTWTRQALEYIYPGFWGYSTWIDKNQERILGEYKRLAGEKYRDLDEAIEGLSKKSKNLGELARAFRGLGGGDFQLYLKALKTVQDQSSLEYYQTAKEEFIYTVQTKVEQRIARRVVNAVNRARRAIVKGNEDVDAAYNKLSPKDQKEVDDVYNAVRDRFTDLRQTVDERQHEIIGDVARTYNKSVSKLKATFDEIKKDVLTSWLEKAWNKLKAVVNAIIEFAKRIAQLVGRIVGLVGEIVSSPRYFFNNLVTGIGQGFSTFVDRIDEFLATAFFDWLRGSSGVMVQLPKEWSPKGIFSLFTQLLNLSTETIWQRMEVVYDKTVANAFRRGEVLLDRGLEIFDIVKREGLGGLWDHIVESLGTLLSDTLNTMKETVLYAAIKKVIFEIGKMLVPGGGFIAIAEKVVRLVQFLVEARNKILDLIESFIASMEKAVKGDIPGIVKLITGALTKFITVALDFLVTFFGLGSIKEKVERLIERMRSPIIRGIDWVLGKFKPLVMKGKELVEKGKEKVVAAGKAVVQVGVPEDPNERLKLGRQAGLAAINRFAGRRVGNAVLMPLLSGIRIRYGFVSLEVVPRDGKWHLSGEINPRFDEATEALTPESVIQSEGGQTLLVGEGNFTFALSIAAQTQIGGRLVATDYMVNERKTLKQTAKEERRNAAVQNNVAQLESMGVQVVRQVDAINPASYPSGNFDSIVFNHPLVITKDDKHKTIRGGEKANVQLIEGFLVAAKQRIKEGGSIIIISSRFRLQRWKLDEMAERLQLEQKVMNFLTTKFPGYTHEKTLKGESAQTVESKEQFAILFTVKANTQA